MQENPQEFESLRKLLALKRHEIPPPGYFNSFSNEVLEGIKREQAAASVGLVGQLMSLFRARPALSWSFSTAMVLVLFAASSLFDGQDGVNHPVPSMASPTVANHAPAPATAGMVFSTNFLPAVLAFEPTRTNEPVPYKSLFDTPFYRQVAPVSFQP